MILIADGGSTSVKWAVADEHEIVDEFTTGGLNPLLPPQQGLDVYLVNEVSPHIRSRQITHVYYYGAGCLPHIIPQVKSALSSATKAKQVEVYSDMLGAARSLCGHSTGIACILGTGANSCLFDGTSIIQSTPPLGFILGDEGSGAVLGRRLLSDIFKGQLPSEISDDFFSTYKLTQAQIIDSVYRHPAPNRFLASFAPFIASHIDCHEIEEIVIDEFSRFIKRNIANYPQADTLPIHFTGSIAYNFQHQLSKALQMANMALGTIAQNPLQGLVKYHVTNRSK